MTLSERISNVARVERAPRFSIFTNTFAANIRFRVRSPANPTGLGRTSFHSPVSDVVKLNQLLRASSRAHDRRRKVYSTYISLGFSGVVDECFNNFDSIVDEGVRRLKLFYSDGYFSESNYNSELNRLVTGSYCAVKIVQSVCGEREIRGFMEITSARERYENAIEVMERHTVEMLREINEGDERPGGLV